MAADRCVLLQTPFMTPRTKTLYAFVGDSSKVERPASASQGIAAINRAVAAAATGSCMSDDTNLRSSGSHKRARSARSAGGDVSFPGSANGGAEIPGPGESTATARTRPGSRAQGGDGEDLVAVALVLQSLDPTKLPSPKVRMPPVHGPRRRMLPTR